MEDLELRVQKLEKSYRTLKGFVVGLTCFAVLASLSGLVRLNEVAKAAEEKIETKYYSVPKVIEAETFILKDSLGNIRGVWTTHPNKGRSSDVTNSDPSKFTITSFAMMPMPDKSGLPRRTMLSMAVDDRDASLGLTDVSNAKITIGSDNAIRAISISDETGNNNIRLGITGSSEASIDMVSPGTAAVAIDGVNSTVDMTGNHVGLALKQTSGDGTTIVTGTTTALQAQSGIASLTFLDYMNKKTMNLSTTDGLTELFMSSPATKEEKTVSTAKEILAAAQTPVAEEKKEEKILEEAPVKKDEEPAKKDESAPVDMKNYSPFSK